MAIEIEGEYVASKEAGLEHLRSFTLNTAWTPGFYYALLMEHEDAASGSSSYKVVERRGMPCWGALREYNCGTRPEDSWPDDLMEPRHIFPKEGKPVAVSACISRHFLPKPEATSNVFKTIPSWQKTQYQWEDWNTFMEFCYNKDISPWRKALKDAELIKNDKGIYWGVMFNDTNIDPNIMIGLLRTNSFATSKAINFCQYMRDNPGVDPRIAYLLCGAFNDYYMVGRVILERWFNGEPEDISAGSTFYERESYNRPDISYLFGGKKNRGEIVSKMKLDDLQTRLAAIGG